jgi:hypothetical protein
LGFSNPTATLSQPTPVQIMWLSNGAGLFPAPVKEIHVRIFCRPV